MAVIIYKVFVHFVAGHDVHKEKHYTSMDSLLSMLFLAIPPNGFHFLLKFYCRADVCYVLHVTRIVYTNTFIGKKLRERVIRNTRKLQTAEIKK